MSGSTAKSKSLLIVAHMPSVNTRALARAVLNGARHPDIENVSVQLRGPFDTHAGHVLAADGIILGTPENFGYMSGAMKDFFDRIYYDVIDVKQGMAYGLYVRAGLDGTGTLSAIKRIVTGLRWKPIAEPTLCHGAYQPSFESSCEELGQLMAASLDAGIV